MDYESKLIQRSVKGDEESFKELIDIYKGYVFAIILNFIKDYEEVENIAQEVFLQVYLSLDKYREDNFKAWIGRIASNKSIDYLRSRRNRYKEEILEDEEKIRNRMVEDYGDSPEDLFLNKEARKRLLSNLNKLPKIYKRTLERFYFQDKSYKEIAREEKVSEKTIASRLYRGKIILKEKWREGNETF